METDASNVDELSLFDDLSHVSKIDASIVDELSSAEIDAPNVDELSQLDDLIQTKVKEEESDHLSSYPQIRFDQTISTISSVSNNIDECEFLNDIDDYLSPYPQINLNETISNIPSTSNDIDECNFLNNIDECIKIKEEKEIYKPQDDLKNSLHENICNNNGEVISTDNE